MEPRDERRSDSLSLLAAMTAEERTGTRRMRVALAAAVGLHVVLFAIHWPSFASERADTKPPRITVLRLEDYVLKPPEVVHVEPPKIDWVPVPDPTPQGPEPPLRPPDVSQIPDVDIDEQPFEVPDPPPVPDPPKTGPVRAYTDVEPPAKVFAPDPVYPKAAMAAGLQGFVVLECLIDRDGRVADVKVLRAGQLGMAEAAVEAVRRWRFEPSTVDGEPVEVLYILTVRFTLRR